MKSLLRRLLAVLAGKAGGALVSKTELTLLRHQRLALLLQASAAHRASLAKDGAVGYVFSFNRPTQLHALLVSYFHHVKNPAPLIVQYAAKGKGMAAAYADIQKIFAKQPVTFVTETTCRETFLVTLLNIKQPKLFFLVDDDIFIRPVDLKPFCAINPLDYVPSLRLAPHLSYSYTMKLPQPAPQTLKKSAKYPAMFQFDWGDEANEWNYPFSVEGHLFDTAEIVAMSLASPFKAPNTLEGVLHSFADVCRPPNGRPGLCYTTSKLVNNACNKVQTENNNHAGETVDLSPEYLLEQWQKGLMVDVMALANFANHSPCQEIPLQFIPRPKAFAKAKK